MAAEEIGIKIKFEGDGVNEVGVVDEIYDDSLSLTTGDIILRIDPTYFRPTEVETFRRSL